MLRAGLISRPFQRKEFFNIVAKTSGGRNFSSGSGWFGKLLSTPKGFGKYWKKPGEKIESSSSSSAKNNTNSRQNTGSSSKGGGKKPASDTDIWPARIALITIAFLGLTYFLDSTNAGREISYQDFQNVLLDSGYVDKIIVSNKNIAKVVIQIPLSDMLNDTSSADPYNSHGGFDDPNSTDNNNNSNHSSSLNIKMVKDVMFRKVMDGGYASTIAAASSNNNDEPPGGKGQGLFSNNSRFPSNNNIHGRSFTATPYYFYIGTVDSFEHKLEESQRALNIAPRDYIPVIYVTETKWSTELMKYLPTFILLGGSMMLMRSMGSSVGGSGGPGGIFKIGKSTAKKIQKEKVTTKFADVAGCDEAKKEILEFVQFLKDSKKFTDLGAKIPKGALLCGPPGTGKTLLAKATAGEADVPFYSISGSDFVEMYVGVGPSRVRDLFKEARENAPCILFIDEIDAVGKQRGRGGPSSGSNDERENTLNQLLVEMDGFDATTNIVVLAGTNRVDVLDQALTRPGRFDRQIQVDKPDIKGRKAIFEVYLKNITLDGEVELFSGRLAALTPGFVGADIANICNEAAIVAARRNKDKVDMTDFESATDRIIGGMESKKIMSYEERRVVAYHEAGHAVAGWNLEFADPLLKVTIVPRGSGALGFAQYLPKELFLRTRDQILDIVCMALAGRASEQINFGKVTTGASDDLRRVTQIVYQMVQVYGMNDKIGQVAFPREDSQWPQDRLYSNATAEVMDQEVRAIVDEAYKRTLALMEERKEQVRMVAEMLLEKETITNMDIASLIGVRKYSAGKEYDEYVNVGWGKVVPPAAVVTADGNAETETTTTVVATAATDVSIDSSSSNSSSLLNHSDDSNSKDTTTGSAQH